MIVCHCEHVSDRTVRAVALSGAADLEEVTVRCGAGGDCGGCLPALQRLLDECRPEPRSLAADADAA